MTITVTRTVTVGKHKQEKSARAEMPAHWFDVDIYTLSDEELLARRTEKLADLRDHSRALFDSLDPRST